jgi:hypothetical protein
MEALAWRAVKFCHQLRLPGCQGNASIGEAIGIPADGLDHHARQETAKGKTQHLLQAMAGAGTRALLREEIGENYLHAFALGESQQLGGNAGEVVEHIAGLRFVPPTQWLDLNADFLKGSPGLLDLNLRSPMRQRKWCLAVE